MTIHQCLVHLDSLKHNTYSDAQKITWLSELDGRIRREILDTHVGGPEEPFSGYDADTPREQALLAAAPYDGVYLRFLEAQLDYHNGELEKYNNSILMFQSAWEAFSRDYHRSHMPRGQNWKFQ